MECIAVATNDLDLDEHLPISNGHAHLLGESSPSPWAVFRGSQMLGAKCYYGIWQQTRFGCW